MADHDFFMSVKVDAAGVIESINEIKKQITDGGAVVLPLEIDATKAAAAIDEIKRQAASAGVTVDAGEITAGAVELDTSKALAAIDEIKKQAAAVSDIDIKVNAEDIKALADGWRQELKDITARVDVDATDARRAVDDIRLKAGGVISLKVDAQTIAARAELDSIKAKAAAAPVVIDIKTNAQELEKLTDKWTAQIQQIEQHAPRLNVDVTEALAAVEQLKKEIKDAAATVDIKANIIKTSTESTQKTPTASAGGGGGITTQQAGKNSTAGNYEAITKSATKAAAKIEQASAAAADHFSDAASNAQKVAYNLGQAVRGAAGIYGAFQTGWAIGTKIEEITGISAAIVKLIENAKDAANAAAGARGGDITGYSIGIHYDEASGQLINAAGQIVAASAQQLENAKKAARLLSDENAGKAAGVDFGGQNLRAYLVELEAAAARAAYELDAGGADLIDYAAEVAGLTAATREQIDAARGVIAEYENQKNVLQTLDSLAAKAETAGMSSDEKIIYNLEKQGADVTQLNTARALLDEIAEKEQAAKDKATAAAQEAAAQEAAAAAGAQEAAAGEQLAAAEQQKQAAAAIVASAKQKSSEQQEQATQTPAADFSGLAQLFKIDAAQLSGGAWLSYNSAVSKVFDDIAKGNTATQQEKAQRVDINIAGTLSKINIKAILENENNKNEIITFFTNLLEQMA